MRTSTVQEKQSATRAAPLAVKDQIADLPVVGDGSGLSPDDRFMPEEVRSALRNRGLPLEMLRESLTPTGLHYLIIHFDIPDAPPTWSLEVGGLVERPLSLSLHDLQHRPTVTRPVTMECAGNGRALLSPRAISQPWFDEGVSTATWTGTPLRDILREAGLMDTAREVVFTGRDWGVQGGEVQAYQRSLVIAEALREEVLLAHTMNGSPLPPQHGAPVRLLVPGWYGMTSVKWLSRIDVVADEFMGYQMMQAYRYQCDAADPGAPVTLIQPRALMVPPGIPEFATRTRIVPSGPVVLTGRAWTGRASIARVDFSPDDGASWSTARLHDPVGRHAWRGWEARWTATPGRHTLCVRATDDAGMAQPLSPTWNVQGMGNNTIQKVEALVLS